MGMPARKFEFEEVTVEDQLERIIRLESNVEHIQSDVSEIKADIKGLNGKIDGLKDQIAAQSLTMEKSLSQLRIWVLMSFGYLAAVVATAAVAAAIAGAKSCRV